MSIVGPHTVKNAGVIWLLLLIGHLRVIGLWVGEDQRHTPEKTHVRRDWTTSSITYTNWEDLSLSRENQQLVTNEPVEVGDFKRITDHFRGIYREYASNE